MADFEEIGFKDAVKFMKGLEEKAQRPTLLAAMRIAARPLSKEAKRLAPVAERNVREFWGNRLTVTPGTLKRSIKYIVPKAKKETLAELYVGPKKAKKRGKNFDGKTINASDGWFRHFVIRGTSGKTIKSGKNKGRFIPGQPANAFMDEAANRTAGLVNSELEKAIKLANQRYCKRNNVTIN